ncbi:DedA family protein [Thalassobius vesicularis]|uniref:DedA family protein n=1 Tax=Thalassobius vesicularis TaxID=1294297 RepID=A0A4S3M8U0_9RHOB|nr:YqaA family protein [Thalassobius vesicularis]THD73975.1 DedA family protein [Thalassobius vesicularis]
MNAIIGLFLAAFLAASLFPAQSEAVLVGLLLSETHPAWLLFAAATVGNVLGSLLNWLIGRFLAHYADRRWFPVSPRQFDKAAGWYARWGYWSLLASWVPIIGDPLTLVAGVLREPLWRFTLIVTVAKGGRYLVLTLATLSFI